MASEKASSSAINRLDAGACYHAKSMRRVVAQPNVVALGIGEKMRGKKSTGKLALTFYVERKVALSKLRADALIPSTVPEALSGPRAISTDVIALGQLHPELTRRSIQPGHSIGLARETGTIGAVVRKGKHLYLLSNSHIMALSGRARKGDVVICPGVLDRGRAPRDLVARLSAFKKFIVGGSFVNHADCAIAKPTTGRLPDVSCHIKGLGVPRGTTKPRRGMAVVKVGRTTGKTTGKILDANFSLVLRYPGVGLVGFADQVLCTKFTKRGDSGSLVLERGTRKAVGLHFAGAKGGSVFNPIDTVLQTLKVTLVTSMKRDTRAPRRRG
jgi:hypothetical protein